MTHKKKFFHPKKIFFLTPFFRFFFQFFFFSKSHRNYGDIMPGFGTWSKSIIFMVKTFAVQLSPFAILEEFFCRLQNSDRKSKKENKYADGMSMEFFKDHNIQWVLIFSLNCAITQIAIHKNSAMQHNHNQALRHIFT